MRSESQLTYVLTKGVSGKVFEEAIGKLDKKNPMLQLEEECGKGLAIIKRYKQLMDINLICL